MWDDNLRFLRKIPSVLFALLVMLLTCLFHFRSSDIVIPRYLGESVIGHSGVVVEGVRVENVVPFTSSLHSVAFVNVKIHPPGEFPLGYRIKVSLQKCVIAFGFDAAVEDAIISKETDCTIDGFVGEVIDVYQK